MVTHQLNNKPVAQTLRGPEDVVSDTKTLIENRPPSVAALFMERVAATPDAEAYRHPVPPATGQGPDDWKSLSWGEAATRVYAVAAGLIVLGVRPEERVALAADVADAIRPCRLGTGSAWTARRRSLGSSSTTIRATAQVTMSQV